MTDTKHLAHQAHATRTGSAGWMIQRVAATLKDDMQRRLDALDVVRVLRNAVQAKPAYRRNEEWR